ncbi:hypothetical protein CR203_05900 [Salipaludibacillus neizhouensis]|uniref:Lipoprotein n=2 Tax=Salipaludibacillus neizhouensis TaxID=885475 RepID=A0A3A9KBX8_9BACI|nr:hypothetical protein [Salipaludibacillus neizhouensis]RKL68032.1 hypothetical protein CR203_05900 [Salipaludibacillus neizhouensis]
MMKKKLMLTAMSSVLTLGVLAACGGNNEETPVNDAPANDTGTETNLEENGTMNEEEGMPEENGKNEGENMPEENGMGEEEGAKDEELGDDTNDDMGEMPDEKNNS